MPAFIDLVGLRFGRLVVLGRGATKNKKTYWVCACDCGTRKEILAYCLKHPDKSHRTSSCGCLGRESRSRAATLHGLSKTDEFKMFWGAKKRAAECGIPFNIEPSDIFIPEFCPLLGIPLFKVGKIQTANSPALDRIDPSGGYTKGNVQVISNKANAMKSNASFEEFERMYFNWKAARRAAR